MASVVGRLDGGAGSHGGTAAFATRLGAHVLSGSLETAEIPWSELAATVHRQMRAVVGPTRDLEDLAQAALEQILLSLDRFRGEGELTTFTYRVCVNVALNHWRWYRRWLHRFTADEAPDLPASEADPSDMALELERARRLHACLARLSPILRVIVTLADLEDLPASAIAKIVGCPEPTVRSRLRRARIELAELLARDPIFADGIAGGEP